MRRNGKANIEQRNWRSWKRGKEWVFGCSLFFTLGSASLLLSQTTAHAEHAIEDKREVPPLSTDVSDSVFDNSQETVSVNEEKTDKGNAKEFVTILESETTEAVVIEPTLTDKNELTALSQALDLEALEVAATEAIEDESEAQEEVALLESNSGLTSDGLIHIRDRYDISFTDTSPLSSRNGKGDLGFVKLNDNTIAYLYNFTEGTNKISLAELRERLILTPKSGTPGTTVHGRDTKNYYIRTDSKGKYFSNSWLGWSETDALYLVSVNTERNNHNLELNVVGTANNGDGGQGNFNRIVPLNVYSGQQITRNDINAISSNAYYTIGVHLGSRIVQGTNGRNDIMYLILAGVDNQLPTVDEEATKRNFERNLNGGALTAENLDSILQPQNVEVKDNVNRKALLLSQGHVNVAIRDEQGVERSVAEMKSLLQGPQREQYANKTYTIVVKATDEAHAKAANSSQTITPGFTWDIVDKNPLQAALTQANNANTTASTANKTADSVAAYEQAKRDLESAKQDAQRIMTKPNASAREILDTVSRVQTATRAVQEKEQALMPTEASTHRVEPTTLTRSIKDRNITQQDLLNTISNLPSGARITLNGPFTLPNTVGQHPFTATIAYQDKSSQEVRITLNLTKDKRELEQALANLRTSIETEVDRENKSPLDLDAYDDNASKAQELLLAAQQLATNYNNNSVTQQQLDEKANEIIQATAELDSKREAIGYSLAYLNPISTEPVVVKKVTDAVDQYDLDVAISALPEQPVLTLDQPFVKPATEGSYAFEGKARYHDRSWNPVVVQLILETDWTEFEAIFQPLQEALEQTVDRTNKSPKALAAYDQAKIKARELEAQFEALRASDQTKQAQINKTLETLRDQAAQAVADLTDKYNAIVEAQSVTYSVPELDILTKKVHDPVTADELLNLAAGLPGNPKVTLDQPFVKPTVEGLHIFEATATYADDSTNKVTLKLQLDLDWSEYNKLIQPLQAAVEQTVERENKSPKALAAYDQIQNTLRQVHEHLRNLRTSEPAPTQEEIDEALTTLRDNVTQAIADLAKKREAIVDSLAYQHPIANEIRLNKKVNDTIETQDLIAATNGLLGQPVVTLNEAFVKPTTEGVYRFEATALYEDDSTNRVIIQLNLETDWTAFDQAMSELNTEIRTNVDRQHKNPLAVAAYDSELEKARGIYAQLQALRQSEETNQATIDEALPTLRQEVDKIIAELQDKRSKIVPSHASTHPVATPAPIVRSIKNPASEDEILAAVTLPENAVRVEFAPDAQRQWTNAQTYQVPVNVIYQDTSVNRVMVQYTLNKDWTFLEQATNTATGRISELEQDADLLKDKRPSTVVVYRRALRNAQDKLQAAQRELQHQSVNTSQQVIDHYENQVKEALAQLNDATGKLVPSDAATHTPTGGTITRTTKTLALAQDLIAVVSNYPETASVALVLPYNIPTTKGTHIVQARVNYQDQTSETVDITYIINLDFQAINRLKAELEAAIETGHGDKKLEEQTKRSVQHYQEKLTEANSVKERLETLLADPDTQQSQLDAFERNVRAARAHLQNAVAALTLSEATRFTPRANPLVRDTNTLATATEIANSVIVLDTYQYQLALSSNQEVPSREGEYRLRVTVTYRDESSEEVEVLYTVNTYKVRLSQANYSLNGMLGSKEKLSDKAPDTAEAYEAAWNAAQEVLQASRAIHEAANSSQQAIDEAERQSKEALANLVKARDELRPSQAATHTPRMDRLEKTMRETITLSDIREHLKDIPEETEIISNPELVKREGSNFVNVTLRYPDRSTEDFGVYYYYTTVKTDLTEALNGLHTKITERPVTSDMLQSTVDAYNEVLREAERQHREDNIVLSNSSATQADLDAATERIKAMSERLAKAREGLKIKDSVTYPVQNGELTTTIKNLASDEQLLKALGDLPGGATGEIIRRYGNYVGIHHVAIQLTYPDTSTNTVQVVYTITLHKDDLANANTALEETINQEVNLENVSPKAIRVYEEVKRAQQNELNYGKQIHATAGSQDSIDTTVTRMEQAKDRMLEAINGLVPSEAYTTTPTNGALTKTVKETVTVQELIQTVGGVPATARVTLAQGVEIPRNEVKTHILNAVVTYQDESVDHVEIHLTLTTDLTALNREKEALESALETEEATEGKRPSTVEAYQEARQHAQEKLAAAQRVAQNPASSQESIDQATQEANQATDRLKRAAAAIVNSDATTYTPNVAELTRTMKNLALESDVFQQIAIQGATFTTALAAGVALPNSVGKHKVRVLITYNDRSTEEVEVPYTITVDTAALYQKNTDLHNAIQQSVALVDKTKASIARYESEKQRVQALLAAAQQLVQSETQDQQRIDDEVAKVHQAIQDLQAAVSQLADTQAKLIEPEVAKYSTHAKNLATVAQLTQAVTIPQTSGYTVTLPSYTDDTLPKGIGTYRLMGTVVYQDESSEQVAIDYTITPYTEELSAANTQLKDKLAEPVTTEEKRPSTVSEYERALQHARQVQAQTQAILDREAVNSSQESLDEQVRLTKEAQDRLVKAIAGLEDSDAKTYHPTAQALTRTLKNLANADDLTKLVTGKPDNAGVSILETIPQQVGEHKVIATVNYQDGTSETVEIAYTITTDKDALSQAITTLAQTDEVRSELEGIRPSDVAQYRNAKQQAEAKLAEARAMFGDPEAFQSNIDAMVEAVNAAQQALHHAQTNLNPSDATLYNPTASTLTKTINHLASIEEVKSSVTISGATGYQINLDENALPKEIGSHQINATVVYADTSTEQVTIPYIITTDKAPLANANNTLSNALDSILPADTADMSPVTIAAFHKAQQEARTLLEEARTLHNSDTNDQNALDQMAERINQARDKVAQAKAALRTAQSVTVDPVINPLVVTVKNHADQEALKARVTNLPQDAEVVLTNTDLPTDEGVHEISATVRYADQSSEEVTIRYEITSDKTDLTAALGQLEGEKNHAPVTDGMKLQTVEDYQAAQANAVKVFEEAQATLNAPSSKQVDLDNAQQQVEAAKERLKQAKQALVPSLATENTPQERELTRTVNAPATAEDITGLISNQNLPANTQFELQNADAIPTDLGTHSLTVKVIYEDRSEDTVTVRYTVTTDISGLELAKKALEDELAKQVSTEGKRQSTIEALNVAKKAAQDELASVQDVLAKAGPTQADIESAVTAINDKLSKLTQAVTGLEDSYATLLTPTDGALERTVKNPAKLDEILETVTVTDGSPVVTLAPNVTIPETVGRHELNVIVTYNDQSVDTAKVVYTITTHKADLISANDALEAVVNQSVETNGKRASTVEHYQAVKERVNALLTEAKAIVTAPDSSQSDIDAKLSAINNAKAELLSAIEQVVDSDATTYTPTVTPLVRKINHLATAQDIEGSVQVAGATNVSFKLKENQTVPQSEGIYTLKVVVTYNDQSSEEVDVQYTIETYKGDLDHANTLLAEQLQNKAELGHRSPQTAAEYAKVWDQVTAVLQETQAVFGNEHASQTDIDDATKRARTALEQLEAATQQLEDSLAHTHQPTIAPVEKTTREKITQDDLRQAVSGVPSDTTLTLNGDMTHNEGANQVTGTLRYSDGSTEEVTIDYTYRRVKDDLTAATNALKERIDTPAETQDMRPTTIEAYQQALQNARTIVQETNGVLLSDDSTQSQIDEATRKANEAKATLDEAISNLTLQDSVKYPVADGTLTTTMKELASNEQLIAALGQLPEQVQKSEVTGSYQAQPGLHPVEITLIYQDGSTKVVRTNYTITLHKQTLVDEIANLQQRINQQVVRENISPKAMRAYEQALIDEQAELMQAQQTLESATQQDVLDAAVVRAQEAVKRMQSAIDALVPSLASQTQPTDGELTRTVKQPANVGDITSLISTQTLPVGTRVELQDAVPTALGEHSLTVKVIYTDDSEDTVTVNYTVTTYTDELNAAKETLAAELAKEVLTEGKRQSTIEALDAAREAANQALASAQEILAKAGPTQEAIETAIATVNEKLRDLQKAAQGLEDSYATQYEPTNGSFERTVKQPVDLDQILATVTTPGGNPIVTLLSGTTLPTDVGSHTVNVLVTYDDKSTDTATIHYTITTHKTDLEGANQVLQTIINREAPTDGKRQSTVDHYNQTHKEVSTILAEAQTIVSDSSASQAAIDEVLARVIKAKEDLEAAFDNIVDSDATNYTPNNGAFTAKATQPATKEQLEATITVNETTNIQVLLDNATLPTEVGAHRLEATVVYEDKSSEKAYVDYTILLDTDAVQAAKNKLQQKLAEYVKETDRSQATLNNYRLAKQAADNAVQASEQFLTEEVATAKQPAADAIERQLENAYAELVNAIEGLRDSQASTNQPNIAKLTRTLKDAFDKQQLIDQVTELPANAYVVIVQPEAIPTTVGDYQVAATVHYEDLSTKTIAIPYEITTYTDELAEAQRQLQELVANQPELGEKSPVAIRHYQELLDEALRKIAESNEHQRVANTPQTTLNEATEQLRQLKQQLSDAVTNLVDAQAKLHEPQVTDLTTKVKSPVTEDQLKQQIVTQPGASVQLQLPHGAVPTTVGSHVIPVTVTYEDESVDNTTITLVIEVDPTALNEANTKLEAFLAKPGVDNTGENVAETGQTHKQLPATGETESNLLAYALTSLTGFASVVLGRKKKEEEETD
ncbi:Rib/alpha-like domain-containing protein [Aerococcaceae bacterium NML191292]|nr:Rib/alpha-like domain-containing protein [Aerococcaceae bacterium NML191292]